MASFTDIPTASLAVGKPVTSSLVTSLRDNTLAAVWHPYNKTTIGDANTGLVYDFSVSGTVSTIVTPDFVDGYEYMLVFDGISHNSGTTPTYLQMELYRETSAAYTSAKTLEAGNASPAVISGQVLLPWVRSARVSQLAIPQFTSGIFGSDAVLGFDLTTSQKVTKARLSYSSGSVDAGKVYLYRRGNFAA